MNKIYTKKNVLIALAILVAITVLISLAVNIYSANNKIVTPTYKTVLPNSKTIDELGGWKLSSPPNNTPVFSYIDSIDSVSVSVSQQPIPNSFAGDVTNKVTELAKQNNANTEIDATGIKAYLGTSAKGPQSVIFVKNDLLIFIKSQGKISNESWIKYIENLE